jgi:antitoxin component of MazEF toxin-antitoxin module
LVALRCTQRLLKRLRVDRAPKGPGEAANALGHWYANVLTINRTPLVLAISERSLLSVVLPGAPFNSLVIRFPSALAQLLHALTIPEDQVAAEVASMSSLTIAATASRQLVGCLTQYAFELSSHFYYEPQATLVERQIWLSDNISSAIRYSAPHELARELLAARGKRC